MSLGKRLRAGLGKLVKFRRRTSPRRYAWLKDYYGFALLLLVGAAFAFNYLQASRNTRPDADPIIVHNQPENFERVAGNNFRRCGRPPHDNCVIDGDTFYFRNQSIRIADIDTPETNPARCEYEARLGEQATQRLLQLLNNGPFDMETTGNRDEDQYGRKLRVVTRSGRSLGGVLTEEGLARKWTGRRLPWCE